MQTHISPYSTSIITIAALFIIMTGLQWSASFFGPLLFAFTLTLLIWPVLEWFGRRGVPRQLAIAIVAIFLVLLVGGLIVVIASSLKDLSDNIPFYTEQLTALLQPLLQFSANYGFDLQAPMRGSGFDTSAIAQAGIKFASGFIGNLYSVLIFLLMLFLMVIASDGVVKRYNEIAKKGNSFTAHFSAWSKNVQAQYRVQTISNLISGFVSTILFLIFGVDFAILWGVLVFLLAYIPNYGIVIASIPPVLLALITSGLFTAVIIIALITLLNVIMDNIVTPRLMGSALEVPSIAVFISFIFFSFIFGLIGAFIALPLLLAIRQILFLNPDTKFLALLLGSRNS